MWRYLTAQSLRWTVVLLLIFSHAILAAAAKRVSVEELDQRIASIRQRSDSEFARELSQLELTQRPGTIKLAQWLSETKGPRSREALTVLLDQSWFLSPPPSDIPSVAPPDLKERLRILSLAVTYVNKTLAKLPDFLVRRDTTYFEDEPSVPVPNPAIYNMVELSDYRPLHVVGRTNTPVTYRDGQEVMDAQASKRSRPNLGWLSTNGEFGPIVSVVIGDATRSMITWNHWEHGATGTLAVFRYKVPQSASHFRVRMPCLRSQSSEFLAYHGEIALDPANGAILRLTVLADPEPPCNFTSADIGVEYGPVVLGDRTYICPLKSVSLSESPIPLLGSLSQSSIGPIQTQINDVSFTDYHVFGSASRIVDVQE